MSDRPAPDEYQAAELLAAMRAMLAKARAGVATARPGYALHAAYVQACKDDERYGNLAGLMLFWVIGGLDTPERLDVADRILNGDGTDPRKARMLDVVHRLAAGEMSWAEFVRVQKKGLIPKERPEPQVAASGAVPLRGAEGALRETLARSTDARRSLAATWTAFTEFACRPVAAPRGRRLESDMCLFQWGVHDWGQGPRFECDLTRQFVLHTGADDYGHMEQLSVTLMFDPADPAVAELDEGELWSGDDLESWIEHVEALAVFTVLLDTEPLDVRIVHENV